MPQPPPITAGTRVSCSRCGGVHTLRGLDDEWTAKMDGRGGVGVPVPPRTLFVRCQDTLFLAGIGGMLTDPHLTPIC